MLDPDFSLSPVEVKSKTAADSHATRARKEDQNDDVIVLSPTHPEAVAMKTAMPESQLDHHPSVNRSAPSQSANVSIFAPSSLTPASNIPSSGNMAEFFKGKNTSKKRKGLLEDDSSDEGGLCESSSKKQSIDANPKKRKSFFEDDSSEEESAPGPPSKRTCISTNSRGTTEGQSAGVPKGEMRSITSQGSRRKVTNPMTHHKVCETAVKRSRGSCSISSGVQYVEEKSDDDDDNHVAKKRKLDVPVGSDVNVVSNSSSRMVEPGNRAGLEKDVKEDLINPPSINQKDSESEPGYPADKDDIIITSRSTGAEKTQRTPMKREGKDSSPTTITTTSSSRQFLSTRKNRRKSDAAAAAPGGTETTLNTTAVLSAFNTQPGSTSISQKSFTSMTSSRFKEVIPLTAASTGGRRSKANPADALWAQEDAMGAADMEDEEDPLGEESAGFPSKKYLPVKTADGFIKARERPKLKVHMCMQNIVVKVWDT